MTIHTVHGTKASFVYTDDTCTVSVAELYYSDQGRWHSSLAPGVARITGLPQRMSMECPRAIEHWLEAVSLELQAQAATMGM